ncbi:hypothetical protein MASR2M78_37590 [Treponema sp.]
MESYSLTSGVLVTPKGIISAGSIAIRASRIASFSKQEKKSFALGASSIVYPALLNVHDHLRGNYLPRVGPKANSFYLNWLPWDNDLKASSTYSERSNLTVDELYSLSAYKNLFSGVTTVNDHFPHELNDSLLPKLPIRAFREYCLAHECSSFDLNWGDGIGIEHQRALDNNWPFITHLEEGFDAESMDGVGVLERLGRLEEHCLLIHCIGLSEADIAKIAKAKASNFLSASSTSFKCSMLLRIDS